MFLESGASVHGIDFSERMLKKASRKLAGLATLELLSIFDIDKFDGDSFDIVTENYVFHEYGSASRIDVLRKSKRIMKRWFVAHDYGRAIPFIPRLIEAIEKGEYKDFILKLEDELNQVF